MSALTPLQQPIGARYTRILGVGGYRPSRVVTNDEICTRIESSDEWIRERTGIVSRRFAAPDETVADMSVDAAAKAIANAGIAPDQVGAVILATISHPMQTPSAAAEVAFRLGTNGAAAFDVAVACAGFCYGISLANDMVRGGSARYVVVIGVEKLSDFIDHYDRTTAFIFADGAGAVVVGPSETPGIGPTVWGSDGSQLQAITQNQSWVAARDSAVFPTLTMQGQAVFRWAVWQMAPVAQQALDAAGVKAEDLDAFIPHQANVRIIDALVKTLKLPSHVPVAKDIVEAGNTSAASIPLAMERMLETGQAKSGGTALLIGFGAGLTYAAQVVTLP